MTSSPSNAASSLGLRVQYGGREDGHRRAGLPRLLLLLEQGESGSVVRIVRIRSAAPAAPDAGAPAEHVAMIVRPELVAEKVERKRVDAGVDERQAEAGDLEDVPEHRVLVGIIVVPERVDVTRKPASGEDEDE